MDFLIPKVRDRRALEYDHQSRRNEPRYRCDAEAVDGILHPLIGEEAEVEEEDREDGKADRDGPAYLLDVDRLHETMSEVLCSLKEK